MTDPTSFISTTPNYSLPYLFAGQSQKEFFVNQAHMLLDTLVHTTIIGQSAVAPASPDDGDTWLIAASPSGDWTGQEGNIATFTGTGWLFIHPRVGMRAFDQQTGQTLLFDNNWQTAEAPSQPQSGATIDVEARQTIAEIISELRNLGIFARS